MFANRVLQCFPPVCQCFPPVCQCFPPVCQCFPPVCQCLPPVCQCFPPVCQCFPPVCQCFSPVCQCFPPVCQCFPPVCQCCDSRCDGDFGVRYISVMRTARLCMDSSCFVCCLVKLVCHTWQVYSTTDRTSDVYMLTRWCDSTPARLSSIMKYSRCDALAVISSMWDCHFKSAVSVTPSSRVDFTCSMGLSLMVSGGMSNGDLLKQMRSSFALS